MTCTAYYYGIVIISYAYFQDTAFYQDGRQGAAFIIQFDELGVTNMVRLLSKYSWVYLTLSKAAAHTETDIDTFMKR